MNVERISELFARAHNCVDEIERIAIAHPHLRSRISSDCLMLERSVSGLEESCDDGAARLPVCG